PRLSLGLLAAVMAPVSWFAASGQPPGSSQPPAGLSASAAAQIDALVAEKKARTTAQRKMASSLIYGAKIAAGRAVAAGVASVRVTLPMAVDNRVLVDVRARVSGGLLDEIRGAGG